MDTTLLLPLQQRRLHPLWDYDIETNYVYSTYGPGFAVRAGNEIDRTQYVINSERFDDVFGEENAGVPAIAVAVNQENKLLVVGGYDEISGSSFLRLFDVSEPMESEPIEIVPISSSITSVASNSDVIAISTESGTSLMMIPQKGPVDPPVDSPKSGKYAKASKSGKSSKLLKKGKSDKSSKTH